MTNNKNTELALALDSFHNCLESLEEYIEKLNLPKRTTLRPRRIDCDNFFRLLLGLRQDGTAIVQSGLARLHDQHLRSKDFLMSHAHDFCRYNRFVFGFIRANARAGAGGAAEHRNDPGRRSRLERRGV